MHDAPPLTRRQQALHDYLLDRAREGDQPPTLDEICNDLGLKSRGSLHKHIQALVDAGLVEPMERRHRGVRLRDSAFTQEAPSRSLPLFGTIAAGRPIEALETPETVDVPEALCPRGNAYVLNVRGYSMIEDGILDGDQIVVEQRETARNGEVVVALVDGREATLKRIEQRPGVVVLHPANATMEPLRYAPDQVQVQGVLVALLRDYRG